MLLQLHFLLLFCLSFTSASIRQTFETFALKAARDGQTIRGVTATIAPQLTATGQDGRATLNELFGHIWAPPKGSSATETDRPDASKGKFATDPNTSFEDKNLRTLSDQVKSLWKKKVSWRNNPLTALPNGRFDEKKIISGATGVNDMWNKVSQVLADNSQYIAANQAAPDKETQEKVKQLSAVHDIATISLRASANARLADLESPKQFKGDRINFMKKALGSNSVILKRTVTDFNLVPSFDSIDHAATIQKVGKTAFDNALKNWKAGDPARGSHQAMHDAIMNAKARC